VTQPGAAGQLTQLPHPRELRRLAGLLLCESLRRLAQLVQPLAHPGGAQPRLPLAHAALAVVGDQQPLVLLGRAHGGLSADTQHQETICKPRCQTQDKLLIYPDS
jgi:hypothetical protein